MTSLVDILRTQADERPQDLFVRCRGVDWSYGAADLEANRAAAVLRDLGIKRGDHVAVVMNNSLEFLSVWFGIAKTGAVIVPVNTALRGEGLEYILRHSQARLLVVDSDLTDTVLPAAASARVPNTVVVRKTPSVESFPVWQDLTSQADPIDDGVCPQPHDLASILYTSGTTGLPKGVMLPHHSYVNTGRYYAHEVVRVGLDDRLYTVLPLFHVNAQQLSLMGSLVSGVPLVLGTRFSASGFWDEIRREQATVFNYIGAMIAMLHKQPERPDDADNPVRLALGAAAPEEIWEAFERRFGCTLLEGYGLTETGTIATMSPPDAVRVGSIGVAIRWCDVRIVDEHDLELPPGQTGEIVVRFTEPNTGMLGYYNDEAATDKAMRGGWFHTGDRGRMDPDRYFYFVDRLKDSIRRRGENISSFELEKILAGHEDVVEVAVVGVPSELGEEEVLAVVVPRDVTTFDPAAFWTWSKTVLASFQVPRFIRVIDELPKTETQRTRKFLLREQGVTAQTWEATPSTVRGG